MSTRFDAVRTLAKFAQQTAPLGSVGNPHPDLLAASNAVVSQNSNEQALRTLASIALLTGGAGVLARGLQGARRLAKKTIQSPGLGKIVTLPILEDNKEEKQAQGNAANSITAASARNAKPANPGPTPRAWLNNPIANPNAMPDLSNNIISSNSGQYPPGFFNQNPMAAPNTFNQNITTQQPTQYPANFFNRNMMAAPNTFGSQNITTRQSGQYPANFFNRNMISRPAQSTPGFSTYTMAKKSKDTWSDFFSGSNVPNAINKPWFVPAALMTALGSGYLGWKGTDAILDARRKAETEEEMNLAENAFRQALLSNYETDGSGGKLSKAAQLGQELDKLYDAMVELTTEHEKSADMGRDALGLGLGLYGGYASLSALLAGLWAHRVASKRSRHTVLEKALKKRQREDYLLQPAELYATPDRANPLQ